MMTLENLSSYVEIAKLFDQFMVEQELGMCSARVRLVGTAASIIKDFVLFYALL